MSDLLLMQAARLVRAAPKTTLPRLIEAIGQDLVINLLRDNGGFVVVPKATWDAARCPHSIWPETRTVHQKHIITTRTLVEFVVRTVLSDRDLAFNLTANRSAFERRETVVQDHVHQLERRING